MFSRSFFVCGEAPPKIATSGFGISEVYKYSGVYTGNVVVRPIPKSDFAGKNQDTYNRT